MLRPTSVKSAHEHASVTEIPDSTLVLNGVVGMVLDDGDAAVGHTLPATSGQFGRLALPELAVALCGSRT